MKILVAHNSYQQTGGEDVAVNAEINLLRSRGNEVIEYRRSNAEIKNRSSFSTAIATLWSRQSAHEIKMLCDRFQPDIIHAHNTFPLISPSIYWFASDKGIPVVQTLHNFRLLCPQAMFLRDGKVCEDCLGKNPWRAVARRCYHASAIQSGVIASMLTSHRSIGTFRHQVSAYIAMNHFCREKFIAGGLPADRIHIKPNFVTASHEPDWKSRRDGLFVGRLSEEKGITVLIEAVEKLRRKKNGASDPLSIKIIGAGPLSSQVSHAFKDDYIAEKKPAEVFSLLHSALFLIAPSTCYETFGLAAAEAFSCGVPVIASRHGGLAELVSDGVTGLLFEPGDADDLLEKISWAHAHPDRMLKMGQAAYQEYLNKYAPERNYKSLMDIYQNVLTTDVSYGARHAN